MKGTSITQIQGKKGLSSAACIVFVVLCVYQMYQYIFCSLLHLHAPHTNPLRRNDSNNTRPSLRKFTISPSPSPCRSTRSPAVKCVSAERCMEWTTGICGVHSVNGKRRAQDFSTEQWIKDRFLQ